MLPIACADLAGCSRVQLGLCLWVHGAPDTQIGVELEPGERAITLPRRRLGLDKTSSQLLGATVAAAQVCNQVVAEVGVAELNPHRRSDASALLASLA